MNGSVGPHGKAVEPGDMLGPWAVCLPPAAIVAFGSLRLAPGVEVSSTDEGLWLRGQRLEKGLEQRLRALPGARRFQVLADGQLLSAGARVPQGWIPHGPWTPLAHWLRVAVPAVCRAAQPEGPVPLELRRSADFIEPSILLTSMECWETCARDCSQVRLDRWRFAAARDRRVLIVGRPLPSLPGERFVEHAGIAVPAGWFWSPPVEPAVLRELLALQAGDVALWHGDGVWERVAAGDFARASRAAIRATAEGLSHDGR